MTFLGFCVPVEHNHDAMMPEILAELRNLFRKETEVISSWQHTAPYIGEY
jgi:hypothetical protein